MPEVADRQVAVLLTEACLTAAYGATTGVVRLMQGGQKKPHEITGLCRAAAKPAAVIARAQSGAAVSPNRRAGRDAADSPRALPFSGLFDTRPGVRNPEEALTRSSPKARTSA